MTSVELHLRIVGLMLLLLVPVNLAAARRFNWRQEIGQLSLFTRQVFVVHMAFILLILVLFAGLCLGFTRELTTPSPLARGVLGGLTVFWAARLACQWLYYDVAVWRGNRFNTVVHVVFTATWAYFVGTFGYALYRVC
jgi:hypothetical protein